MGEAATAPHKRRSKASDAAPDTMGDLVSQLKRDRIVSAAVDLFYRQGYAGTTLDEVAKALGMTKPFIYQFFWSKNDLLAEICSRAIRDANDTLNRLLSQQGSPTQKLLTIVREFTVSVLNNQAAAIIYNREETELAAKDRQTILQLRRDFDRRIMVLLEEGVASGEFVIEDVRVAAFGIASLVGWAPQWFRSGGRLNKDEAAERLAMLALAIVDAGKPKAMLGVAHG